ncbi:hypothetical protein ACLMJK_001472 [Lecanora helva]
MTDKTSKPEDYGRDVESRTPSTIEAHLSEPPNPDWRAWVTLLGSFFLVINAWGVINSFGIYQEYYQSTLLSDQSASSISWKATVQGCLLEVVGVFIGPIYDRGYFHSLVYTGSLFIVLGTITMSVCTTYWPMFLAQGLCVGFGSGLVFVPSVSVVTALFTKRRAIVIGIVSSASSIGGIIFPITFQRLIPRLGFRWTQRIIGFIVLSTLVLAIVVLHDHGPVQRKPRSLVDISALREPPFMAYVLAIAILFTGYFVPLFYIPPFATSALTLSSSQSLNLLAVTNAGAFVGRLLPGLLPSVFTNASTLPLATAFGGVITLAWLGIHGLRGFIAFCVLYGALSGLIISLATIMVPALSPPFAIHETIGTRLGMVYFGCGIGVLIGSPIAGALVDMQTASFVGAQGWAGGMLSGGALLLTYPWLVLRSKRKK